MISAISLSLLFGIMLSAFGGLMGVCAMSQFCVFICFSLFILFYTSPPGQLLPEPMFREKVYSSNVHDGLEVALVLSAEGTVPLHCVPPRFRGLNSRALGGEMLFIDCLEINVSIFAVN